MPGSFRTRPDSPHPIHLELSPRPRSRRARDELTKREVATQTPHGDDNAPLVEQTPSSSTRYIEMLLQLDKIPKLHNFLASLFTWLLLAGYMILPGAFTSIRNSRTLAAGNAGKVVVKAAQNLPLRVVGGFCFAAGTIGMFCLWWRWQVNYVWLINRIFL
jgi:hypothetical protein